MEGAAPDESSDEHAVIKDLQKKMLNGQKEEVIKYLQSLPQDEADRVRWQLVKSLERISQRAAKKPVSSAPSSSTAAPKPKEEVETSVKAMKKPTMLLDRYQIGEAIGKGGFATVFRALDTERGDFVAVKEIEKRLLASDQLPKIMQEAELLKKLSHPNIVGFRGSAESAKHVHFVLEFVEGGSLYRVVKKFGTFTEKLCAIYMKQVLQGLVYLHEQNILHRDIKGANLLLTKDGQVKLADFGACTYAALNKNLTVVGTPFWMAPEIIEMSEGAGTSADIWSLGCTILELLTGAPPYFHLGTMQALFKMVEDPHPPVPDSFSADLKDFLMQCFRKDYKTRPSAKQLLTHPWITNNAEAKKMRREELEVTLRAINQPNRVSAKDVFGALSQQQQSAENSATTQIQAKIHSVKQAIKVMHSEQQALQMEILSAQKKKAELEANIARLKGT